MQGETGQFVAYKFAFYYCKGKHFKKALWRWMRLLEEWQVWHVHMFHQEDGYLL